MIKKKKNKMGNVCTCMEPKQSHEYLEHRNRFTQAEFCVLQSAFKFIQSSNGNIKLSDYLKLYQFYSSKDIVLLGTTLFKVLQQYESFEGVKVKGKVGGQGSGKNQGEGVSLNFEAFIIGLAECVKGSRKEQNQFYFQFVKCGGVRQTLKQCMKVNRPEAGENEVEGIVNILVAGGVKEDMTFESFVAWEDSVKIIRNTVNYLLNIAALSNTKSQVSEFPALMNQHANPHHFALGEFNSWLLSLSLPYNCQHQWTQIYHSSRDGRGLSNFMEATKSSDTTLLIIEDTDGNVFGVFTQDTWERRPNFYGKNGLQSFMFRLYPSFQVFHATGNNSNFQWSAQRYEDVPLGIGFGGKTASFADLKDTKISAKNFGLFVDGAFEWGYTGQTTTYNNIELTGGKSEFQVSSVECWSVTIDHSMLNFSQKEGSVLQRFEKERNFIAITGKAQFSEGMMEDIPEEFKKQLRV
eukprot:TRINITY_DN4514_c1_g3_i5.p1 TRINITY_DN4514_c1_g3~~TRINITY_DN4514_c1_g3_i5.p1  ORF type:complete len:465 (+),score=56.04 TRINITY_DN4514_c1_g3_i5:102-1496(+)